MSWSTATHRVLRVTQVAVLFLFLFTGTARAQSRVVEGDVFLRSRNGEVQPGAGAVVVLITARDSAEIVAAWDTLCERQASELVQLMEWLADLTEEANRRYPTLPERERQVWADSLRFGQRLILTLRPAVARVERTRLLRSFAKSQTTASINGHFRFAAVQAGRYILFSELELGNETPQWWVPVTGAGASVTLDLGPSNVRPGGLVCRDTLTF